MALFSELCFLQQSHPFISLFHFILYSTYSFCHFPLSVQSCSSLSHSHFPTLVSPASALFTSYFTDSLNDKLRFSPLVPSKAKFCQNNDCQGLSKPLDDVSLSCLVCLPQFPLLAHRYKQKHNSALSSLYSRILKQGFSFLLQLCSLCLGGTIDKY